MTKPQLKALLQRMEATEQIARDKGDLKLAFMIQQKLVDLAFVLHPEWDRRPQKVAAPKNGGSRVRREPEPTPEATPTPTDADMAALRELSDEELERSLGR